ncbi:MAG: class I SAM-dependent methyltransferase [Polyangiaceae bacterium]
MRRSLLENMTAPYTAAESWLYDSIVAPAVRDLGEVVLAEAARSLPPHAKVLDVGCGGGHLALELLRKSPDTHVTGLDLSPDQIARATRRAQKAGLEGRATFVEGSALDQPFDDEAFDAVISVASIKHWPDQALGLRECVRVLRPKGTLLVFEADRGCALDDARRFVQRWRAPRVLGPVALAVFRTWVAGQALDLEDARSLLGELDLVEASAERVAELPALVLRGQKAPG